MSMAFRWVPEEADTRITSPPSASTKISKFRLRVQNQDIVIGGQDDADDFFLGGKGFSRATDSQAKTVPVEKFSAVSHNHVFGDRILSIVNARRYGGFPAPGTGSAQRCSRWSESAWPGFSADHRGEPYQAHLSAASAERSSGTDASALSRACVSVSLSSCSLESAR